MDIAKVRRSEIDLLVAIRLIRRRHSLRNLSLNSMCPRLKRQCAASTHTPPLRAHATLPHTASRSSGRIPRRLAGRQRARMEAHLGVHLCPGIADDADVGGQETVVVEAEQGRKGLRGGINERAGQRACPIVLLGLNQAVLAPIRPHRTAASLGTGRCVMPERSSRFSPPTRL